MKRIILVAFLLSPIFLIKAQDLRLLEYSKKLAADYQAEKIKTNQRADSLGLIQRVEQGDGVAQLSHFVKGFPRFLMTHNINAAATTSTSAVWPGGTAGLSLSGTGVNMAVWDAGKVRNDHQEFNVSGSRVSIGDAAASFAAHSTHVAGTMIAAGVDPLAKGMSYQATLVSYDWDNDISEMTAAAAIGLQVSNHSYGYITGWYNNYRGDGKWVWFGDTTFSRVNDYGFGAYEQTSYDWDQLAWSAPEYLIVKSSGNDRLEGPVSQPVAHWIWYGDSWFLSSTVRNKDGGPNGYDCIAWNGVAKNILTIGAVYDITTGYQNPAQVVLASFSSTGPTDDGRIKPDLVANGIGLYSTYSTSATAYSSSSGTSMATPNTSGSVGLLLEHQKNLTGSNHIRSATLKGLMIHTADEAGTNPGPDYNFGWGLLNTKRAALLMTENSDNGFNFNIRELTLNQDDTIRIPVYADGTMPLTATIAWTDPPSSTFTAYVNDPTPMLVNDLDVRLISNTSQIYLPWKLDGANPSAAATKSDNVVDNVEKIEAGTPQAGQTWYVQITHKGTLSGLSQQFSLILSGIAMPPATSAWNGSANTDWYDPANWSNGLPGSTTNITIPAGLTNYPTITSLASCQNIAIASGASILDHGNLHVTGIATVEQQIPGASSAWHLLSSPVASQTIDPAFSVNPSTAYDFFTWYEPAGTWVNFKNTTVYPTWNDANGSGSFVAGRGYLVEYQGINPVKQFEGTLNSGTISPALSKSGTGIYAAYNLMGNPYPSSIDWKAASGWSRTALVSSEGGYDMSIWNDAAGNYGTYNSNSLESDGTHGVSRYIPVGQGFMVKVASSGTLGMEDGIRVHANQAFLKSSPGNPNILRLKVSGDATAYSDEAVIEFGHETALGGAEKMFSFYESAPGLFSVKPTGNYSIDFRSEFDQAVIPLSFMAGVDGNYALTASQLESFPPSFNITLEDLHTSKVQNFRHNPMYPFTAGVNDAEARFLLHFGGTFGVNDSEKEAPVSIYASGHAVCISSKSGVALHGEVMVYDILGRRITRTRLSSDLLTMINLESATGCFLVKVIVGDETQVGKVILPSFRQVEYNAFPFLH
ncbi:MAG: S8 family serine peptidase [Bacteroidetes bacterium]|nr:S8 family serine peptidase [Bacteroidota bacterium]